MKYACRKTLADSRPRVRGRFARTLDDSGELLVKDGGGASLHDEDYDEVQTPTDPYLFIKLPTRIDV